MCSNVWNATAPSSWHLEPLQSWGQAIVTGKTYLEGKKPCTTWNATLSVEQGKHQHLKPSTHDHITGDDSITITAAYTDHRFKLEKTWWWYNLYPANSDIFHQHRTRWHFTAFHHPDSGKQQSLLVGENSLNTWKVDQSDSYPVHLWTGNNRA